MYKKSNTCTNSVCIRLNKQLSALFWSHTESEDSKRSKLIFITRLCTFSAMFCYLCESSNELYFIVKKYNMVIKYIRYGTRRMLVMSSFFFKQLHCSNRKKS